MKFILMMHVPRGTGDYEIFKWSQEDIQAHMKFLNEINADLRKNGQYVNVEGLAPPKHARIVRAGKDGTPEVTDGPFAETKEFLAGWWIIDVENAEQAYAIAGRASAAPGPGGKVLNTPIEVRQVMAGPPEG
ncbi:YciI family protein [Pendulispora rubella]|uniref:YciI family protein n=1 Tax=Pendulispora rubella TaxID=2741070 RepID=A0ABZ2KS91_9BACT